MKKKFNIKTEFDKFKKINFTALKCIFVNKINFIRRNRLLVNICLAIKCMCPLISHIY